MRQYDEKLIDKLMTIQGQELKYKQLCEALELPIKSSNSKNAQLSNLQMYCQLETLSNPTRYKVTEVYKEELKALGLLHGNNRYQLMFEAAIYKQFIASGGEPLYLSDMDCLKLFNEVNDNFPYACNHNNMRELGAQFDYMPPMGQAIYRILKQWTRRRFRQMEARRILLSRPGFRLYTKRQGEDSEYTVITNVEANSATEKLCQEIYDRAVRDIMPDGWDTDNSTWVPQWQWERFERRIQDLTSAKFANEYTDLKCIKIVSPPSTEWMNNKLNEIYADLNELDAINAHSVDTVLKTKALDNNTNTERLNFIEYNIKRNPPLSFNKELANKRKKKEDG